MHMNQMKVISVLAMFFYFASAHAGPTKDAYRKAINAHAKELAICLKVKNGKSAKGKKIVVVTTLVAEIWRRYGKGEQIYSSATKRHIK